MWTISGHTHPASAPAHPFSPPGLCPPTFSRHRERDEAFVIRTHITLITLQSERLILNLIVARWDSSARPSNCSAIQKHPRPPAPSSHHHPNHSYPCPPHPASPPGRQRARGQSRKNKTHTRNVPTHKHGVRPGPPLCSTVILTRCLGLGSGHPARHQPQNF